MTSNQTISDYLRTVKRVERRLRQIEQKLRETDEKLDHILFRLIEEDPRLYCTTGFAGNDDATASVERPSRDSDLYARGSERNPGPAPLAGHP